MSILKNGEITSQDDASQQTEKNALPRLPIENASTSTEPFVGSIYNFANIDWRVLALESGKALLISESILEERMFGLGGNFAESELRHYLNGEFYNRFSADDRAKVCHSNGDSVFLLSVDEVRKYFNDDADRVATYNGKASSWWLRTPCSHSCRVRLVNDDGSFSSFYSNCEDGVRPALWLNL